jgi:hypothetical protein
MCKTHSCILTRKYKVLTHPHSDGHEDIIEKHKLKDDLIKEKREWLRIELHPLNSLTSTTPEDWTFILDEGRPLPGWYDCELAKSACIENLIKEINNGRYTGEWKGLSVGGYLYLRGTQIKELPDNLSVGGSLDLQGTQIKELPDNLSTSEAPRSKSFPTT